MVCPVEVKISLVVVQANEGMFLAFVPEDLGAAEVSSGFEELGVQPCQVFEINDWRVATTGLAVTKLPVVG